MWMIKVPFQIAWWFIRKWLSCLFFVLMSLLFCGVVSYLVMNGGY